MRRNFFLFISFYVFTFSLFAVKDAGRNNEEISIATILPAKKKMNAPVIKSIANCEGVVTIYGTFEVPPPSIMDVKIFLAGSFRIGQPEEIVFLKTTRADEEGNWQANLKGLLGGEYIKVLSEDIAKNTSEMSSGRRVPLPFIVEESHTNISCYGDEKGEVDIRPSGGLEPYRFHWAHGPKTEDLTGLKAGLYNVKVEDAAGCVKELDVRISEPAGPLKLSFVVMNASCVICSDGSIDATVTGGTPGYDYLWNNNFTTEDLQTLDSGIYCLTVADAVGCEATLCATISELYFIHDYGNIQTWNIYPNPAKNVITIHLFDPELIGEYFVIRDLLGKIQYNIRLERLETSLDITLLQTGTYIVSILTDRRLLSSQLVVNK